MEIRYTKIIGWFLLTAGLVVIAFTLISSYNIFTGQKEAPAFFALEKEEVEEKDKRGAILGEAEIEEMIGQQIKEIMPLDLLPQMLNLIVWSMLTFILIFGGSQIGVLGIKLIKS